MRQKFSSTGSADGTGVSEGISEDAESEISALVGVAVTSMDGPALSVVVGGVGVGMETSTEVLEITGSLEVAATGYGQSLPVKRPNSMR